MVESKFAILDITSKLLNWLNESRLSYNYSQSQKESNSKDANQKVKTQYFNDIEIDNGLIKIRITNHHPNYQNYYNRYKNGEIMPLSDSNNISIEFYEKSVKRNRIYNKVKPSEDDDNPQEFTINIFNYMPSKLDKGDLDTIFKSITSFIQSGDKYVDPFAGTPKEAISSAKLSKFEHTQIDKYSNKLLNNMRYNEKRSLYESIMKDVAKIVKRHLNENSIENPVINYNDFFALRTYAFNVLKEAWDIATDFDVDFPIAKQVHAVNDNNLYVFVIKEDDRDRFTAQLSKEISDYANEINIQNLSKSVSKTSTDVLYFIDEEENWKSRERVINYITCITDGKIILNEDKNPYILYVTTDKSILNHDRLMHRASKVFVQKDVLSDRFGNV